MRLSIFREVPNLPKDKKEKGKAAAMAKSLIPEVVDINNEHDLIEYVTNFVWSSSVFNGRATNGNFSSCDVFTLDIDESLTINEAESIITNNNLTALVLPTVSHTEECNRFRIIFPLSHTITNERQYMDTFDTLKDMFPMLDDQCSDRGRIYFSCTMGSGFFNEGILLSPTLVEPKLTDEFKKSLTKTVIVTEDIQDMIRQIYGEDKATVPESISFFLKNAHTGINGRWIWSMNAFCYTLSLHGIEEDIIISLCESLAPESLDDRDMKHIQIGIKDGKKDRLKKDEL